MHTQHSTQRRPHFRRSKPPPIRITDDDIAIVRHVDEHRFRRSTDLVRLLAPRPPKKIIERLGVLYHTGYLDRPPAQRDYFTARTRPAYIYALGNRGAGLLHALDGTDAPKVDWTDKNRTVGRPFMHHQLLVGDIVSAVRRVPRHHPNVAVIEAAQILERAPQATREDPTPWTWHAKVPTPDGDLRDTTTVPDYVCALDFTDLRKRYYFFVEADRATMPIMRTNSHQTSVARKFLSYFHGHRACYHNQRYGIGNARFLTLTTSPKRISSMMAAVQQITGAGSAQIFLFADITSLIETDDFLSLQWINGDGKRTRLFD